MEENKVRTLVPRDLISAGPHRQFHTLPGPLDSRAALPNFYPKALCAMLGGSLYHFYMMVFGMTWPGGELTTYCVRGGHAIKPLRQPNMVILM